MKQSPEYIKKLTEILFEHIMHIYDECCECECECERDLFLNKIKNEIIKFNEFLLKSFECENDYDFRFEIYKKF